MDGEALPRVGNVQAGIPDSVRVAVLLRKPEGGVPHLGLSYKISADDRRFVHHGWELPLSTTWNNGGLWAVPDIEPLRMGAVAWRCHLVAKRYDGQTLPYAMKWHGSLFDQYGELVLGDGAKGLTCATFVLAVFKSDGFDLIDEADWPLRVALAKELVLLAKPHKPPRVAARLHEEALTGGKRILPEEVYGACTLAEPPAPFEPSAEAGKVAVATLASLPPA